MPIRLIRLIRRLRNLTAWRLCVRPKGLHFQVEVTSQVDIFLGERAIGVGDGQRVFGVRGIAAGEEPQGALGRGALDGNDAVFCPDGQ